ncbi:MAG: metallophosphoesterase, partial [Acidimicrobiia bacterium]|nr:metallophosphoesterase [Acidimicrobiia bacterium]
MTFLLAQLTDTHIIGSRHEGELYVDNNDRLRLAVERIMAETVLPDAVLITGDLTDLGTDEEMELILGLLEPLTMPVLALPGNHDRRPTFRQWFDMPWVEAEHLSWVIPFPDFLLVGLDTLVDN